MEMSLLRYGKDVVLVNTGVAKKTNSPRAKKVLEAPVWSYARKQTMLGSC